MGEAAKRGTKQERQEQALEKSQKVQRAIKKREFAEGLVWMAIEQAPSVPMTDETGAFIEEEGKMLYGPDQDRWEPLAQDDVPNWVREPGVINELRQGVEVSMRPEEGGKWYRGIVCSPSEVH